MYVFVCGNQRSGTTFLYQLLCGLFKVGYIDNVAARFPNDSVAGVEESIRMFGETRPVSYRSEYGNTPLLTDPSEFGWFWGRFFALDAPMSREALDAVPWAQLRLELEGMQAASHGLPLVFKCAGMGLHASRVAKEIPAACFAWIARDFGSVVASTLRAAKNRYGTENAHYGFRYPAMPEESKMLPLQRVRRQVQWLEEKLFAERARINFDRVASSNYAELVADPYDQVARIGRRFGLKPSVVHP